MPCHANPKGVAVAHCWAVVGSRGCRRRRSKETVDPWPGEHPSTGFDRNRGAGPLSSLSLSLQTMVETVLDWVRTWRPMLVRLRAVPREASSWLCTEHVPWGYLCRCCLRLTLTLPCVSSLCCTGQWATGHYHGLPTCSVAAVVDHLAVCDTESRVVAP